VPFGVRASNLTVGVVDPCSLQLYRSDTVF